MPAVVGLQLKGMADLQSALAKIEQPAQDKLVQKALTKGAVVARHYIQAAAPVGAPGNKHSSRGALQSAVRYRQARTKPGAWIRLDKKASGAFYAHMVVGGTKRHRIRFPDQVTRGVSRKNGNIEHPGAKARPFVAAGFAAGEEEIVATIFGVIDDALAKL